MRRIFSFRSSSPSGSGKDGSDHPDRNRENIFWEQPGRSDEEERGKDVLETHDGPIVRTSNSRQDACPVIRRSLSFESLPGRRDALGCSAREPACYRSLTPERSSKLKKCDLDAVHKSRAFEMNDSSSSSKAYHSSSGYSPHSSPVPLRCRVARVRKVSDNNEVFDQHTDEEQREHKLDVKMFPGSDGCLVENKTIINTGRPPRAYSTAPSSPTCYKENARSYPSKSMNEFNQFLVTHDWQKYDFESAGTKRRSKRFVQRFSNAFSGETKAKSLDCNSETTVEDIYEDTNFAQGHLVSDGVMEDYCLLNDDFDHYKVGRGSYLHESPELWKEGCFDEDIPWCLRNEKIDKELSMKLKEAKERLQMISEIDIESKVQEYGSVGVSSILQLVKESQREKRNLTIELITQIEWRIAERSCSKGALKKAKTELSTQTRRLEKEKQELQSCLEKELDRRSCDWALKLENFRTEEQRLRERVRELAEQNVSLQREVSSLRGREVDTQNRLANLEFQINDLTGQLEVVRKENQNLRQSLLELKNFCDIVEADKDCIKRSNQIKEKENSDLHKIVARFQKIFNENEKTISGLRQGLIEKTAESLKNSNDSARTLQLEQIRLTGVEQDLRREMESCVNEVKSLRQENLSLLERLRSAEGSTAASLFRLDNELKARIKYMQDQGLLLLDENMNLCGKLLKLVEAGEFSNGKEAKVELDVYSIVEYNRKYHSLEKGIENLKRSLKVLSVALKEKFQEYTEYRSQASNGDLSKDSKQRKDERSEDHIELELKAEILVTKILREKLLSNELELEQLKGDIASSLREHEGLRSEMQRLQDELASLIQKEKSMEHQMLKKDESFNRLEQDFKDCLKELNANRSILPKLSKERDDLWDDLKRFQETDMLFQLEVKSLKQKIEALEEDILLKEGQISILKDSLDNKGYGILYSSDILKNNL